MVEHCLHTAGATGSSPVPPTIFSVVGTAMCLILFRDPESGYFQGRFFLREAEDALFERGALAGAHRERNT